MANQSAASISSTANHSNLPLTGGNGLPNSLLSNPYATLHHHHHPYSPYINPTAAYYHPMASYGGAMHPPSQLAPPGPGASHPGYMSNPIMNAATSAIPSYMSGIGQNVSHVPQTLIPVPQSPCPKPANVSSGNSHVQSVPRSNNSKSSSNQPSTSSNATSSVSTNTSSTNSTSNSKASNDSSRRRRTRCKKCESCLRADCGDCHFCKDMKKFGGPGRMKQSCIARQCLAPVLPHTACCVICGRDGWEKLTIDPALADETASSLMECSQCWEIVHPFCLNERFPDLFVHNKGFINKELPNSWECPKCVKSGNCSKQQTGKTVSAASFSSKASKSINWSFMTSGSKTKETSSVSAGKRLKPNESPPPSDDEENQSNNSTNKSNKKTKLSKSNVKSTSQHTGNKVGSSTSSSIVNSSTNSTQSTKDAPHHSLSLQVGQTQPNISQSQVSFSSQPYPSFPAQQNQNAQFIGYSQSSENPYLPMFGASYTANSSNNNLISEQCLPKSLPVETNNTTTTNTTTTPIKSDQDSTLPSKGGDPVTSFKKEKDDSKDESPDKIRHSSQNEQDLDVDTQSSSVIVDTESSETDIFEQKVLTETKTESKKPLKKPLFVVRPAPLEEDVSESDLEDSNENDFEDHHDENDLSDGSEHDNKERKTKQASGDEQIQKKIRDKKISIALKRFNRKFNENLALEKDVILPIFRQLSRKDLLNCMMVSKLWNDWCFDPSLWKELVVPACTKINSFILIGIVRRQPKSLDLSWATISNKQLSWLLPRLPQLQTLKLVGSSSHTVSALHSCNCPLLSVLDLSWTDSLCDDLIRCLLSKPSDSRPGLLELKTRLRFLSNIRLAGTSISDETLRLIIQNLPFVERIDISQCHLVTDSGIAALSISKGDKLIELNLSGCSKLTDASLKLLQSCKVLELLDIRHCDSISIKACEKFIKELSCSSVSKCAKGDSRGDDSHDSTSSSRLVNLKKKIIHSMRGVWTMSEEKLLVRSTNES